MVDDVVRGQWSYGTREKHIKTTCQLDAQEYPETETWVEQEPGSGGKESAERTVKMLAGFNANAESATGDKVVRAQPFAVQVEWNNVGILLGQEWNVDYIKELRQFPLGKYKDQMDGTSGAFNKLTGEEKVAGAMRTKEERRG